MRKKRGFLLVGAKSKGERGGSSVVDWTCSEWGKKIRVERGLLQRVTLVPQYQKGTATVPTPHCMQHMYIPDILYCVSTSRHVLT